MHTTAVPAPAIPGTRVVVHDEAAGLEPIGSIEARNPIGNIGTVQDGPRAKALYFDRAAATNFPSFDAAHNQAITTLRAGWQGQVDSYAQRGWGGDWGWSAEFMTKRAVSFNVPAQAIVQTKEGAFLLGEVRHPDHGGFVLTNEVDDVETFHKMLHPTKSGHLDRTFYGMREKSILRATQSVLGRSTPASDGARLVALLGAEHAIHFTAAEQAKARAFDPWFGAQPPLIRLNDAGRERLAHSGVNDEN